MIVAVGLTVLAVLIIAWVLVLTRFRQLRWILLLAALTIVFLILSFFRGSEDEDEVPTSRSSPADVVLLTGVLADLAYHPSQGERQAL